MTTMKLGPVHATPAYTIKIRGEHGCSVYGNPAHVQGQVDCYLASRPAGIVDVFYSEHCAHCGGSGRVHGNRRLLQWKPCPVCKGSPEITADTLIQTIAS